MNAPAPYLAQAAALLEGGRIEEAQQLLLRNARGKAHPHSYYLLSIAHEAMGQFDQALYFAQRATAADPADPMLAAGESQRLFVMGRTQDALTRLEAFSARTPDPSILSSRVTLLSKLERDADALALIESFPRALREHPAVADAHATVLAKLGRLDEARVQLVRANRIIGVANLLTAQGRTKDAAAALKEICQKFPDEPAGWTNYASTLNYLEDAPLDEILRAHIQYAAAVRKRVGAARTQWNVTPDPERPLRVGIVSPDLRRHAIVSFLAPLLEHYDRSQWHLTAYSVHRIQDDVSERLKSLVDAWRWFPTAHTQHLVRRIVEDRIDVLIDLSGHTEMNKLEAMHLRPAPVQATYLGYPNTTGLDTIDLRIIDSITDPPGSDALASEKLVRIDPCFLCFKPIDHAPPLALPPLLERSNVSFGSFNLPKKISPGTLAMWGRLLAAVPNSTLVLKHAVLTQEWMREQLAARLVDAGIDASRVSILPPAPGYTDHLAAYANIDIALDTYPYHGTTTTCEAMWMGVPVITLRGDRHAARVGCSLLSAVGLGDLIANDAHDFVAIGTRLAADRERLIAWRTAGLSSLREQMTRSLLCDAKAFSVRFQSAIRDAWRAWCAGRAGAAASS